MSKRKLIIIFIVAAFVLAACQAESVTVEVTRNVEVTRIVTEEVIVEGETVEVTRVVSQVGIPTTEPAMEEEAMEEEAEAVAAQATGLPLPTASPASGTPVPQPTPPQDNFFETYGVNPFISTAVDHLSTFALDVDTGSYSIARRYVRDGLLPPPDAIRVEEFVNYFDQEYALPPDTAFALFADGAPSPFHHDGTYLIRIGVQGYDVPAAERPSASLTFVIDVSGSMAQENRLGLVKQSLELLVERMRPDDQVSIVVYGSNARIVLEPTDGTNKGRILDAINALQPEGSTNLEAGMNLGYQMANAAYRPNAINRVIIASDGVANVGITSPDALSEQIRGYADAGITLTTIGFGMGNYNDVTMEQLADQGNGSYAYVDTIVEAEKLFVEDLTATLQTIAIDAKVQVDFNPDVVSQYRLIGYENRAVADQDFRNDAVDAGEIGAGHTATALYAVQFYPGANGRIATVYLRWEDPEGRQVQEMNGNVNTSDLSTSFEAASPRYQLAVVVAQYAELLRNSFWSGDATFSQLSIYAQRLAGQLAYDEDVSEFAMLVQQVSGMRP